MICFTALDLIGALLVGRRPALGAAGAADGGAGTGGPPRGICYLAVGAGDPAWDNAAPPPDRSRTALTAEVYRVPLRPGIEISYDAAAGAVDVRVALGPGMATGALREVGLFGGPATAAPGSGLLVDHKVHDRIDKAPGDTVNREIRLVLPAGLTPGARDLVGGLLAGTPGLGGLQFAALGSDGSQPAQPPAALIAEAFRAPLAPGDLRYDPVARAVLATLTVPYTAGPPIVAEAGLFGGGATAAPGTGLLVQRQVFGPVDRSVPRPLVRRFVLSLIPAGTVPVPAVTGQALDAARAALVAVDLVPGPVQQAAAAGAAAGTVTQQQPAAGTAVPVGTRVTLTVAAATSVPVPGVLGLPVAAARQAITAVGLVPGEPQLEETDAPRGSVIAVQPPPGTLVPTGSTVAVTEATVPVRAVPDLLGRTPAAAGVLLAAAGFRLAAPPYQVQEGGSTAGTIVQQAPAGRTQAPIDQPVSITLAIPWGVTLPGLTGNTPDAAAQALRDAAAPVLAGLGLPPDPPGLTLGASSERPAAAGETVGTVVGQQPAAGSRAPLYGVVTVVLAGPVRQPVPDLAGLSLAAVSAALASAGFALGAVGHRATDTGIGQVVDQDPAAGSAWPPGGRVGVSIGIPISVTVPDLGGMDQAAATEALAGRGLAAGTVTAVATGPGPRPGEVIGQQPAAGAVADKGSTVAISVAAGMPNLIGRTQADAVAAVTALGLAPTVQTQPDPRPAGLVISQNPAAGAATQAGQAVQIVVAVPPPVQVPNVLQQLFPAAQQQLAAVGLVLVAGGSQQQAGVAEGSVLALDPAAGTTVQQGSTVTATLAVAPPVMVAVPALIGMTQQQAQQACTAVQLSLAVTGSRPVPGTPAGTVLEQSPAATTSVQVGSTVSVLVAAVDTSVLVPDLRSQTLAAAQAIGQQAGLTVAATGTALSLGPGGVVLSQDPLANTRVPAGATINVTLSVAAVTMPDVRGDMLPDAVGQLQGLGLVVQSTARRFAGGDGSVLTQFPAPGTLVAVGATVSLVYSLDITGRPPKLPIAWQPGVGLADPGLLRPTGEQSPLRPVIREPGQINLGP